MNFYMLSCQALEAKEDRIPVSVSLVQAECQKGVKPSNNLRIFNRHRKDGKKRGIAVCTKALTRLDDNSMRFIEWMELVLALGAEKVMIGALSVHPNLRKVSRKPEFKFQSSPETHYLSISCFFFNDLI